LKTSLIGFFEPLLEWDDFLGHVGAEFRLDVVSITRNLKEIQKTCACFALNAILHKVN